MLGGAWERGYISLTRLPQQLHEQHAMLSLFSWAYSACVLFGLLFRQHGPGALSRSILRFSAFRLLCCLRSPSRVTSREHNCAISTTPEASLRELPCELPLRFNMAVRNTRLHSVFSNVSQRDYRYSTNTKLTVRRTNTYIHTYRHRLRSTR